MVTAVRPVVRECQRGAERACSRAYGEHMTISRLRSGRAEGGEATAKSPLRETDRVRDHYVTVVVPAMGASYQLCNELISAIMNGTGQATPERIVKALSEPRDMMTGTYTKKYRDDLRLCCLNYGIDPSTGKPISR